MRVSGSFERSYKCSKTAVRKAVYTGSSAYRRQAHNQVRHQKKSVSWRGVGHRPAECINPEPCESYAAYDNWHLAGVSTWPTPRPVILS